MCQVFEYIIWPVHDCFGTGGTAYDCEAVTCGFNSQRRPVKFFLFVKKIEFFFKLK